ncbi:MAG TPA: PepSY domain-containing protein, partial [Nitrososphaeraceae archaeon]
MNKKAKVNYWLLISGAITVSVSMLLPLSHNVQAQQNSTGFANKMTAAPPTIPTANWTGSVQILPTIMQAFKSQIHINLNEATTNALQAVGTNSSAVAAFIHPESGFLVYNVFVMDGNNNNIHKVIVDAGNGKVLSNQQMSMMQMMAIM